MPQDGALPSANDLDKMAAGGIDSLRVMMPWGIVEQSPGKYDWSQTDAMIRALVEHGIAPYPFLYGTPSWAAEKDRRKCSGPVCAVYAPQLGCRPGRSSPPSPAPPRTATAPTATSGRHPRAP